MAKLELIQVLSGHKGKVWGANWHPKNNLLASCGEDKTIRIWGEENKRFIPKTILSNAHNRTIRSVSWSPCGTFLASASFDATTSIWDKKSGEYECCATLEGHENEVKSVSWSKSGHFIATCGRDKSVWVWELTGEDEYECAAVLNSHSQDVKKVKWHPINDILSSTSYDNTIKLYKEDLSDNDWVVFATLSSHTSTVWSLDFDATGSRIASCSDDKTVKIWQEYLPGNTEGIANPNNEPIWKCACTLSGFHSRTIYDISWNKENGLIATACGDDMIRIFKESTESTQEPSFDLLISQVAHSQDINTIQWCPTNSNFLISTSDDGDVKLWKFSEIR